MALVFIGLACWLFFVGLAYWLIFVNWDIGLLSLA
jgi:hypothetical protein